MDELSPRSSKEILSRLVELQKPHWLVRWSFWVALAAAIYAGIAALDVMFRGLH